MMRILLLNLSAGSIEATQRALAGQGYQIIIESGLTVEEILSLSPEILVTEGTPSDMSSCDLITQVKSHHQTGPSVKVEMIVHGGALERAHALDLGADDVISFPFHAVEFAARVRTQFRERRPQEELMTMLNYGVQREHYADIAVESLSGGTVSKRRFWLIPALLVLTGLTAGFMAISTRSSRKATLQLRAEIARLNSDLQPQADLLRHGAEAWSAIETNSSSGPMTQASLKEQSEDPFASDSPRPGFKSVEMTHHEKDCNTRV